MTYGPHSPGWIISVTVPDREGRKPRTEFYDVAIEIEEEAIEAVRCTAGIPDDAVIATIGRLTERARKAGHLKPGEIKAH